MRFDARFELGFIGNNIWKLDTYAFVDGKELHVQTYQFNRIQK
ncbi:hypothetical protein [Vibrio hangzhouensis]|nr:hypothetical protein [Vibrio hangzhouensis]